MDFPVSRSTLSWTLFYDGLSGRAGAVDVPVEMPVNIVYGNIPYAVMMMTPADLDDFIHGFSLTEGIIKAPSEIRDIHLTEQEDGIVATVHLKSEALQRHLARRRTLAGRTSCGLCGIESLEQLPAAEPLRQGLAITPPAIRKALHALDDEQLLHQKTHAVHAAAWCDSEGTIQLLREDVGRHNALDKLIGACLQKSITPRDGFVVITSRCSFEMLEKTAIFGATTLVAISAPTSLAIERAKALGVTLVAVARRDTAVAFTHLTDFQTRDKAS